MGSRGLMDRVLDLKPEVTQGCGFESIHSNVVVVYLVSYLFELVYSTRLCAHDITPLTCCHSVQGVKLDKLFQLSNIMK